MEDEQPHAHVHSGKLELRRRFGLHPANVETEHLEVDNPGVYSMIIDVYRDVWDEFYAWDESDCSDQLKKLSAGRKQRLILPPRHPSHRSHVTRSPLLPKASPTLLR